MKVIIYGYKIKDDAEYTFIASLFEAMMDNGINPFIFKPFQKELSQHSSIYKSLPSFENQKDIRAIEAEAVITLGGDGTILRVITLIQDLPIPILGINLGRLGFLASVEKKIIRKAIYQLAKKEYSIESRTIIGLKCNLPLFSDFPFALNDFTLNKRDTSSMITIHTFVDGKLLNSYWADGIIISTPTGSTGYSLSCGGPIIFPDAQNFVLTPVAPHNLNVRPIVIPDNKKITLKVEGRTDSFMCTLDSRYETITSSHNIEISKGSFAIQFIQLKGQNFMKTLSGKLLWGLDKRN
ncbi:MAG: NAD kinase [Saprospiraceae bacterium]|jgi:NAD+ kinase|nr:NAD kinase [Saprospiraceae bacterium]